MRPAALLVVAGLLTACTSSAEQPKTAPSAVASSAAPSVAPSTRSEVVAACTHVRTAFEQQATRNWPAVLSELAAAWRAGHGARDRQFADLIPPPGALRLDDTQTLGEVTDTIYFACGLPSRPSPGSSPAAPSRREVEVSVTAVDGVPLGTPADEAEKRLRQSLGDADRAAAGCGGEDVTRLTWGAFSVFLSKEGRRPLALTGWRLRSGVSRVSYLLPYDVQPGDTMRDIPTRVPGAAGVYGGGQTGDRYVVHPEQMPDLLWISDEKGSAGAVQEITFLDPSCD